MKKTFYLFPISLLVILAFSSSICTDLENNCEDSEMPSISNEITLFVQVKYNDGVLFDDKITASIWRETCDGKMRSYNTESGTLSSSGWFTAGKTMILMDNSKDEVRYRFTAYYTPFYPATEKTKEIEGSYTYEQIKSMANAYDEVEKTFFIEIPTDSDGH